MSTLRLHLRQLLEDYKTILPALIHHNQNGFIKGRSVLLSLPKSDEKKNIHGVMVKNEEFN